MPYAQVNGIRLYYEVHGSGDPLLWIGGLGANVLIGGFNKAINLQPVSLQAQTGLNLAAGIAGLSLKFIK